ncbi:AAEL014821-PB [Aedes aegypti]|uniref:AAEL014821-PB n=1 Tax=Aedes aegypti TaxID=7159 RepID=Q16FC7_AEDAE|nr:AAEL014821-PB [Aedes aegypti]
MQKIVVFGGTGMTGQCAVQYALDKGLKVRLMVRNEATVPESFKNQVELVKGDVVNAEDVVKAISDQELVCVVLGTRNDLKPTTMMSTGIQNIVPKMFTELNADHKRMLDVLKASDLEYRAILPPHIADEPSTEYVIAYDKSPGLTRSISKLDLGKFLIEALFEDQHAGKVIGMCTKPAC